MVVFSFIYSTVVFGFIIKKKLNKFPLNNLDSVVLFTKPSNCLLFKLNLNTGSNLLKTIRPSITDVISRMSFHWRSFDRNIKICAVVFGTSLKWQSVVLFFPDQNARVYTVFMLDAKGMCVLPINAPQARVCAGPLKKKFSSLIKCFFFLRAKFVPFNNI